MLVGQDADKEDPDIMDILARLKNHEDGHPRHLVDLQRLRDIYNKRAQEALRGIKADDKQARVDDFNKDPYHRKAYKFLSPKAAAPITFLRRREAGPNSEPPGTFATDPREIDAILTAAWQNIYNGAEKPLEDTMETFCTKYYHLLYKAPESTIEPIDPQAFKDS